MSSLPSLDSVVQCSHFLAHITLASLLFLPQSYLRGKTPTLVKMDSAFSVLAPSPLSLRVDTRQLCDRKPPGNIQNQSAGPLWFSSPFPKKTRSHLLSHSLPHPSPSSFSLLPWLKKIEATRRKLPYAYPRDAVSSPAEVQVSYCPAHDHWTACKRNTRLPTPRPGTGSFLLSLLKIFPLAMFPSLSCITICAPLSHWSLRVSFTKCQHTLMVLWSILSESWAS